MGCGDAANLIGPANQLEVTNQADTFQWQVTALDNVTQTVTYTWSMTGTVGFGEQSLRARTKPNAGGRGGCQELSSFHHHVLFG